MKTKFLLLTVLALLIAFSSSGQITQPQDNNGLKLKYQKRYDANRALTTGGKVVTGVGLFTLFVGAISLAGSGMVNDVSGQGDDLSQSTKNALIAGAVVTAGGITMWAAGANGKKKYKSKLESLSVRVNAGQSVTGLTLVVGL